MEDYVEKVMLADQGVKVLTCNLLVPREEVMGVQPGKGMSGLVLGRKQKKLWSCRLGTLLWVTRTFLSKNLVWWVGWAHWWAPAYPSLSSSRSIGCQWATASFVKRRRRRWRLLGAPGRAALASRAVLDEGSPGYPRPSLSLARLPTPATEVSPASGWRRCQQREANQREEGLVGQW